ncbi:hypothetical protein EYF80_014941 [Liparis tanakae]|uniref:Uncharacterized protein n=1 Tax=Liparis tanakae TaxID=230148 RepID=A0A4Z2IAQ6_9TELE|nr:hypothetical protein EYF80_014941 [Liparis tanakae]
MRDRGGPGSYCLNQRPGPDIDRQAKDFGGLMPSASVTRIISEVSSPARHRCPRQKRHILTLKSPKKKSFTLPVFALDLPAASQKYRSHFHIFSNQHNNGDNDDGQQHESCQEVSQMLHEVTTMLREDDVHHTWALHHFNPYKQNVDRNQAFRIWCEHSTS